MTSVDEKTRCVLRLIDTESLIRIRRKYQLQFKCHKPPPSYSTIRRWHKKIMEKLSVRDKKRNGRPMADDAWAERVQDTFQAVPKTSVRSEARSLETRRTII